MNKKWKDKTALEKTVDIISAIALCVWFVFGVLDRKNIVSYASMVTGIAATVVCLCQAVSFWKEKRIISYIAIAGAAFGIAVIVLMAVWSA